MKNGPLATKILSVLANRRLFLHEIRKAVGTKKQHVKESLDRLEKSSQVIRAKNGTWRKVPEPATLGRREELRKAGANVFPPPTWSTKGGLWG